MKKLIAVILVVILLISQSGIILAAHSDYGCDSCHTPHNSKSSPVIPLWNGSETTSFFSMYSSSTFQGSMDGQPSGSSRLCLSCHDGTNPRYSWMSPEHTMTSNTLKNSHPISFVYDSSLAALDGALKDPAEPSTLGGTIAKDLLDAESKVQCSSCHDIHTSGIGDHMLRGYDYDAGPDFCRMCHLK